MPDSPQPTDAVCDALSGTRMSGYSAACADREAALELYDWNVRVSAAFGETLSYVEVVVRNVIARRLATRRKAGRQFGSWLDDPHHELDQRARDDIAKARRRVRAKHKVVSDDQVIAELSFGFWRFLLARRYRTTLWPDIAGGSRHAPDRALATVEGPTGRLHEFRNRLAHHEPVWNKPLGARRQDALDLLGFVDPAVRDWVAQRCRISATLQTCPSRRPPT